MFKEFKNDSRGNVFMIFALCLVPMMAVAGFAIDFQQTVKRKAKVQLVLDSAVLAAAKVKQTGATDDAIKVSVQQFLDAQISGLGGLTCDPAIVVVSQSDEELDASVRCHQNTSLMKVVGHDEMSFKVISGSDYGIDKIDVAFMFDISGSMNSASRLTNLKSAAQEAVDVLLPDGASAELLEKTRLSMVSYNAMVNAGDYFEAVTGTTPTRTYTHQLAPEFTEDDLTSGSIFDDFLIGLYDTDTDDLIAEVGDNAVIKIEDYMDDDLTIAITMDPSHDLYGRVDTMYLELWGEEYAYKTEYVEPYTLYGDSGSIAGATGEPWDTGDFNLRLIAYDNYGYKIFDETLQFSLVLSDEMEPETKSYTLTSTCVWERDGDEKFTDAAPGPGAYLSHQEAWFVEDSYYSAGGYWQVGHSNRGDHWQYRGNECRNAKPVELTSNKTTLETYISTLSAGGYTAGHLGVAWTWYLVSEDWNQIFDGTAAPLDYTEPDSAKVVILMTDGAFNTEVFPEQGDSATQARALCDNMKAKNIKVYSVALNAPTAGQEVLSYCASGPDFYFQPESGSELTDAYRQIATSISDLRISR